MQLKYHANKNYNAAIEIIEQLGGINYRRIAHVHGKPDRVKQMISVFYGDNWTKETIKDWKEAIQKYHDSKISEPASVLFVTAKEKAHLFPSPIIVKKKNAKRKSNRKVVEKKKRKVAKRKPRKKHILKSLPKSTKFEKAPTKKIVQKFVPKKKSKNLIIRKTPLSLHPVIETNT